MHQRVYMNDVQFLYTKLHVNKALHKANSGGVASSHLSLTSGSFLTSPSLTLILTPSYKDSIVFSRGQENAHAEGSQ